MMLRHYSVLFLIYLTVKSVAGMQQQLPPPENLQALQAIMTENDPCLGLRGMTIVDEGFAAYNRPNTHCRQAMSAYNVLTQGNRMYSARCPLATNAGCRKLQCIGGRYRCSVEIPRSGLLSIFGKFTGEYLKNCARGLTIPGA